MNRDNLIRYLIGGVMGVLLYLVLFSYLPFLRDKEVIAFNTRIHVPAIILKEGEKKAGNNQAFVEEMTPPGENQKEYLHSLTIPFNGPVLFGNILVQDKVTKEGRGSEFSYKENLKAEIPKVPILELGLVETYSTLYGMDTQFTLQWKMMKWGPLSVQSGGGWGGKESHVNGGVFWEIL